MIACAFVVYKQSEAVKKRYERYACWVVTWYLAGSLKYKHIEAEKERRGRYVCWVTWHLAVQTKQEQTKRRPLRYVCLVDIGSVYKLTVVLAG